VDQGFRGLGYGKMLYKALIEEAGKQAGPRGAFVGADECAAGSTSKDAQRVWKSLARYYPSSGNVVFAGPK
jgi:GNAT superfamily N-acetyltransferase